MRRRLHYYVLPSIGIMLVLLYVFAPALAGTSRKFKKGDKVESWYDGQWRPGEIVTTYSTKVKVRLTIDGKDKEVYRGTSWCRRPGSAADRTPPPAPNGARVGDRIEVRWMSKWIPAKLVDYDGSRYMASFTYKGKNKEWRMPESWVRRPGTAGPESDKAAPPKPVPPKPGSSKPVSGYKIGDLVEIEWMTETFAAVVSSVDTKRSKYSVKYLKDGKVVSQSVYSKIRPRTKKAPIDDMVGETRIAKLAPLSAVPDFKVPKITVPGTARGAIKIKDREEPFWRFKPAPLAAPTIKSYSVELRKIGKVSRVFVADRQNGLLAVLFGSPDRWSQQLLEIVSTVHGRVIVHRTVPSGWEVRDVSPCARMALLSRGFGKQDLAVWDLTAKDPAKLVEFKPYPDARLAFDPNIAEFVGSGHIIVTDSHGRHASLFSAENGRNVYRASMGTHDIAWQGVLGDGHWLVGSFLGELMLLDTHTGQLVARKRGLGLISFKACLSADGRRLALVGRSEICVLDTATGKIDSRSRYRECPYLETCDLVELKYILLNRAQLVDMNKQVTWWRYGSPSTDRNTSKYSKQRVMYGGRLWYALRDDKGIALVKCLLVPDKPALHATIPPDMLALKPGDTIQPEVKIDGTAEQKQKVRKSLERVVRDSGFKLGSGASVRLVAETREGREQTSTYLHTKLGSGNTGGTGSTVKVAPKISILSVVYDGKVIWARQEYVGAPFMVMIPEGQTMAEVIHSKVKYDLDFFGKIRLPKQFIKPKYAKGFGNTELK
jgi:hypothetical protein